MLEIRNCEVQKLHNGVLLSYEVFKNGKWVWEPLDYNLEEFASMAIKVKLIYRFHQGEMYKEVDGRIQTISLKELEILEPHIKAIALINEVSGCRIEF